nr:restriction endonuclease subunit S [Methanobrevibacter wolinii]
MYQHAPTLRFKEFDDDWNKFNLGKISNIKKGFTPSTKNKEFWQNGEFNWLSISDMGEKYIFTTKKKITKKALKNREIIPKNTLLMSFKLTIGKLGILKKDMYTNEAIANFQWKNDKICTEFMYYYLSTLNIKKYGSQAAKGITLNNDTLNSIPVFLPSHNEQIKISKFLSLIDEKIDLLEKTLCLHQKFIEGLKESIFSNLNYPKFKLNNFMKISKIKCNDNINKRLTVKLNLKGIVPRETKTTEKEGVTTQYIRKKGQFIYGKQNLYKGAFGIIPKELDGYISSSDIPSFDFINNKLNPYWFYYFISRKNYYSRLEKYSTGTGSKRISPEEFLNIKIPLPPIEKQNNQVKMFNKLIERQNILIKEKEYLYNFKKGLLQKMFV